MSTIDLKSLADIYGLNLWIVKSWYQQWSFFDIKTWKKFFEENIEVIKAQPFVKWVWWKRQLISQLEQLFPKDFNNYFEPFVWWWAVFFNLQKEKSFLSDLNVELINTYQVIKSSPKKLIEFLWTCNYNKKFYEAIRSWDREPNWRKKYTKVQRAWRFIYLNRTCFNWLYRVNSRGEFNVPMWKYTNPDFIQKSNILNTSKLLKKTKAEIKVQSFEKVLDHAQPGDFVYFDPPYDTLSETANFTSYNENWFGRDMQIKLANIFLGLHNKWCYVMLSNHNTPFIREIYKSLWIKELLFKLVKAKRMVNSKVEGRWEVNEIVIMNY